MIPRVHNACSHVLPYTSISMYRMASACADVRLGETSSMLVALRMLMASSDS
jgi:hypothetical protein